MFGIARRVYAGHCEAYAQQRGRVLRLAGRGELDADQVEELIGRINAERAGLRLVTGLTALPEPDRAVIELAGLRPGGAAAILGATPGAVWMRLMRARSRLRKAAAAAPATHDAEHEGQRP